MKEPTRAEFQRLAEREAFEAMYKALKRLQNTHTGAPWQTREIRDEAFREAIAALALAEEVMHRHGK